MKVLLVNGSPHKNGCTNVALTEISNTLKEEGVDAKIYHIGMEPMAGCTGCRACAELGRCVIDDKVNEFVQLAKDFDGFIISSPVHYAAASGMATSFFDRVFFSTFMSKNSDIFRHKPGAAIVCARRAGTTTTLDQLNKYFLINEMPIISGRYWNMVHGSTSDEVHKDYEGMQNMRILARNMAWHLKCQEAGKKFGVALPKEEQVAYTNFIR